MANRIVEVNGVKCIRKNGKLYGMPRTVTNRKIMRNKLRAFLKAKGYKKVNKLMRQCWHDPDVRINLQ